jgi:hypothetical protein
VYETTASKPTLENFGERKLTGGRAYVKLDPASARAIDSTKLRHARRGRCEGGRSTTSFRYRIVATQYGQTDRRIALQPDSALAGPTHENPRAASRAELEMQRLSCRIRWTTRAFANSFY